MPLPSGARGGEAAPPTEARRLEERGRRGRRAELHIRFLSCCWLLRRRSILSFFRCSSNCRERRRAAALENKVVLCVLPEMLTFKLLMLLLSASPVEARLPPPPSLVVWNSLSCSFLCCCPLDKRRCKADCWNRSRLGCFGLLFLSLPGVVDRERPRSRSPPAAAAADATAAVASSAAAKMKEGEEGEVAPTRCPAGATGAEGVPAGERRLSVRRFSGVCSSR